MAAPKLTCNFFVFAAFGFALLTTRTGHAQTADCPCTGKDVGQIQYAIALVKDVLRHPHAQATQQEKGLARLGDRVAVALLKIYTSKQLQGGTNLKIALSTMHEAFSDLCEIGVPLDKKPDVTLFLLNSLARDVADENIRHQVQETIEFVESAVSKQCARPNSQ